LMTARKLVKSQMDGILKKPKSIWRHAPRHADAAGPLRWELERRINYLY
jgi:hypothetical protein